MTGPQPTASAGDVETLLAEHEPVIGAVYLPGRGPRGSVVGCSCLSARDYAAAGFKAGVAGHRAHLATLLADVRREERERVADEVEATIIGAKRTHQRLADVHAVVFDKALAIVREARGGAR